MSKNTFSEQDINKIIELRKSGLLHREIAENMNTSKATITRILNNNGIQLRHITIDDELKEKIFSMYLSGNGLSKIAKTLHLGEKRVSSIIEEANIKRTISESNRKYFLDVDYFKNIDTQEKAYVLGLIYADGNVHRSNNSYQFGISLQESDKYILEKLSSIFAGNRPLTFIPYNDKDPNRQNMYMLSITSSDFCHWLISQGVVPNKSLILKFPQNVPDNLIRHFIRGYMDGNGHISKCENRCSLVSTNDFCKSLQEFLLNEMNIKSYIYYAHDKTKSTRTLCISRTDSRRFLDWLYKDSEIHLIRKYNIYKEKYFVA